MKTLGFIFMLCGRIFSGSVSLLAMIGFGSSVSRFSKINRFVKVVKSSVGDYSYVGPRTRLDNVDVGKFCSISWGCDIGLGSHIIDCVSTSPIFTHKKNGVGVSWVGSDSECIHLRTVIGHDVWVGAGSKIMAGVVVNHGAIVGAGAVVTKDVPAYSIVAGCPAKIIGYRFSEEIIAVLLDGQWWNAPVCKLKSQIDFMRMKSPSALEINWFVEKIKGK